MNNTFQKASASMLKLRLLFLLCFSFSFQYLLILNIALKKNLALIAISRLSIVYFNGWCLDCSRYLHTWCCINLFFISCSLKRSTCILYWLLYYFCLRMIFILFTWSTGPFLNLVFCH